MKRVLFMTTRTWAGLVVLDVVIWVIANMPHSQGWVNVVWVVSLFGFAVLLVLGLVAAIQSLQTKRSAT